MHLGHLGVQLIRKPLQSFVSLFCLLVDLFLKDKGHLGLVNTGLLLQDVIRLAFPFPPLLIQQVRLRLIGTKLLL